MSLRRVATVGGGEGGFGAGGGGRVGMGRDGGGAGVLGGDAGGGEMIPKRARTLSMNALGEGAEKGGEGGGDGGGGGFRAEGRRWAGTKSGRTERREWRDREAGGLRGWTPGTVS